MKKLSISLIFVFILSTLQLNTVYAEESLFSDLPPDHPGYDTVMNLVEMGVVEGYEDGTVKPDQNITRAELLKIIIEGRGITPNPTDNNNCFSDVYTDDWYVPYVCYGEYEGWVVGYPDKTFRPENNINNVEILSMIFNANSFVMPGWYEIDAVLDDVPTYEWYAPYIQYAAENDIIDLPAYYYYPGGIITRIEAFEILERTIAYVDSLQEKVEYTEGNLTLTHKKLYTQEDQDGLPIVDDFILLTKENEDGIGFISETMLNELLIEFDISFEELVESFPRNEMTGRQTGLTVATGKIENVLEFNEYIIVVEDEVEGFFIFKISSANNTGESYFVVAHYMDDETKNELLEMTSSIEVK